MDTHSGIQELANNSEIENSRNKSHAKISELIGFNNGFQCSTFAGSRGRCLNTRPKAACSDPFRVIEGMNTVQQNMVDCYSCIFTLIHLKSRENNIFHVKTHR